MTEEAEYKITVGSTVFESRTSTGVIRYHIKHEFNKGSEAVMEIESDDIVSVAIGDLVQIEIIPWGGSAYELFFYGELFDINPKARDRMVLRARDVFEYWENIDIDTLIFGPLGSNIALDIQKGATASDPVYAYTGVLENTIIKPIVRVQTIVEEDAYDLPGVAISVGTTIHNISSAGNGYEAISTRFVANEERARYIYWKGLTDANYDYLIVEEYEDLGGPQERPDMTQIVYQRLNLPFQNPAGPLAFGLHGVDWGFTNVPFRLTPGRAYWLVIRVNNVANPWSYNFYAEPFITTGARTGFSIRAYDPVSTTWIPLAADETAHLNIKWLSWEDQEEGKVWNLEPDGGGIGLIKFNGTEPFTPDWVRDVNSWQQGLRWFAVGLQTQLFWVLTELLGRKALVDWAVLNGPHYIDFV